MQSETVTNKVGLANQVARTSWGHHSPPSVLLVGASVRWAAESAAAGGYRVVGRDLFGDLDTRAACARFEPITPTEQAAFKELAESITALAGREQAPIVWVGGLRGTVDRSSGGRRRTHQELTELAQNAGFCVPEAFSADAGADGGNVPSDSRWLIKEADSTGGLGVHFRDQWPHRTIPTAAILQRWVPGRPMGLVAIAETCGVSLLGMTRSIHHRSGGLPFIYAGSRTMNHSDVVPWSAMQTLCERVAETRGLRGLFNLDWIHDRSGQWWLLEINERPSASCEVIERALRHRGYLADDDSLMRWHLAAVLSKPSASGLGRLVVDRVGELKRSSPPSTHLKRIVYSRCDGWFDSSRLPRSWQAVGDHPRDRDESPRWQLADIPADGTPVQRGQPIATLLVDSKSAAPIPAKTLRCEIQKLQSISSGRSRFPSSRRRPG